MQDGICEKKHSNVLAIVLVEMINKAPFYLISFNFRTPWKTGRYAALKPTFLHIHSHISLKNALSVIKLKF